MSVNAQMERTSASNLSTLIEPIKIGKLTLKNRIVMAPMCSRLPTPEGEVTQAMIDHYRERAGGGNRLTANYKSNRK